MKVLKREARKELLGCCRLRRGSKADNPRDVPDDRLGGAEPCKQGIERCVVISFRKPSITLGNEERDMTVGGTRQAKQVLKIYLLRGRAQKVNPSHHAVHPLRSIVDDDGELVASGQFTFYMTGPLVLPDIDE